ncbi:hypothetical protein F5148DRAFT_538251 [Russula earlei]|uniref:Uncharacterized protein n=1 Tax=Russula earlei TaxID=71964 RepID=A0ACC0TXI1_9AGAM|nr:hypothetical protein F5148DRAFT_538251 [Russula earlei]
MDCGSNQTGPMATELLLCQFLHHYSVCQLSPIRLPTVCPVARTLGPLYLSNPQLYGRPQAPTCILQHRHRQLYPHPPQLYSSRLDIRIRAPPSSLVHRRIASIASHRHRCAVSSSSSSRLSLICHPRLRLTAALPAPSVVSPATVTASTSPVSIPVSLSAAPTPDSSVPSTIVSLALPATALRLLSLPQSRPPPCPHSSPLRPRQPQPPLPVPASASPTASTSPVAAPVLVSCTATPVASASPTDILAPPATSSPAQSAVATTPSASSATVLGLVPATALLPDHAALSLPSLAVTPPHTTEKERTNNWKTKSMPPPQKSRCHNAAPQKEHQTPPPRRCHRRSCQRKHHTAQHLPFHCIPAHTYPPIHACCHHLQWRRPRRCGHEMITRDPFTSCFWTLITHSLAQ